jgi:hypothetical protein
LFPNVKSSQKFISFTHYPSQKQRETCFWDDDLSLRARRTQICPLYSPLYATSTRTV